MHHRLKIYLAGPDVFFDNPVALGEAKKALCAQYGFEGLFPFDNEVEDFTPTAKTGFLISRLNEDLIAQADLVVANLSPFRGPSADPGTVFEIGYAAGLGKGVHGYSTNPDSYRERVAAAGLSAGSQAERDHLGQTIENFGLADNLMIEGAIHRRNGLFLAKTGGNLEIFEQLLEDLRRKLDAEAAPAP